MYTEIKGFCGIAIVKVTAEWLFLSKGELWIMVGHVTVYADKLWIPEQAYLVTALWKPRLPVPLPAASCEEMDRKKHPGYALFSFCKIMTLFVIAAFFQG